MLDEDDPAQRHVVPDLALVRTPRRGRPAGEAATSPAAPAVVLMVVDQVEVSEPRLVVREVGTRALVTVLELLSPSNETQGSRGREEYLAERREVMRSAVHLVEVDLLRGGERIPSVEPLPRGDYLVHVSRTSVRPRGEVYAWGLRDPAPTIPLPLGRGDADAALDLGQALRLTYDRSGYDLALDYTRPPPDPPLAADDARWAAEVSASQA